MLTVCRRSRMYYYLVVEQKHPEIITRVVLFYRVLMKFLHVTTKNKLYKKEDETETRGLGRVSERKWSKASITYAH